MAKEIGRVVMEIVGTKADGPGAVYIRYNLQDSADPTLRTPTKNKVLESPDLNKVFHNTEAAEEFWTEQLAAIESDEGIS